MKLRRLRPHTVRGADKSVAVTVPVETAELIPPEGHDVEPEVRESLKVQAMLADIGCQMGLKIWIPKGDRGGVLKEWMDAAGSLLDRLPLNYDDATLKTVEQIDVLWLAGRSIIRAFEVEHTTSIYSGLLRMADLLTSSPTWIFAYHCRACNKTRQGFSGDTTARVFVTGSAPVVRALHLFELRCVAKLG